MDITERIEQLLGEVKKDKRSKKQKEAFKRKTAGVATAATVNKAAQRKFIGHGSIKDLAKY
jgi:hypothetical protein